MSQTSSTRETGAVIIPSRGFSESLVDCLTSLLDQSVTADWAWEKVYVIWNCKPSEAQESTKRLDSWQKSKWDSPVVIHSQVEHHIGIPYARNMALNIALENGLDWFVFIDDDCIAKRGWLLELSEVAKESGAEVVAGGWTIQPRGEWSSWLPAGVFGTKNYILGARIASDGDTLPTAYTRNVLVRTSALSLLRSGPVRFDESLARKGGSDVVFFSQLCHAGARIVYAKNAVVDEIYRAERLSLHWNVKRRIRNTQLALSRSGSTGERNALRGRVNIRELRLLFRVPASTLLMPGSIFSARVRRFIGTTLLHSAPYIGALLHILLISFEEYSDRFAFRKLPKRH